MSRTAALVTVLGVSLSVLAGPPPTIEQRTACRQRLAEVEWVHSTWPASTVKPEFASVANTPAFRRQAEDAVALSRALDVVWHRPLTQAQLGAELLRMARGSRQPNVLREMFDVLGNDVQTVAECLVRPALASRLANTWYARDERFHGELRRRAQRAMRERPGPGRMAEWGAAYGEITVGRAGAAVPEGSVVVLEPEEYHRLLARLAHAFEVGGDGGDEDLLARVPAGVVSRLEEEDGAFVAFSLVEKKDSSIRLATATWAKQPFDAWWSGVRATYMSGSAESGADEGTLPAALPALAPPPCTDDTWTPTHADAPDPRYAAQAVWSGTEMLIWGGAPGDPAIVQGWRYRPATDTWTAMSSLGAPASRTLHTVVWTGSEMIVWGGWTSSSATNSGARYNPLLDSWSSTSTGPNVPSARTAHTAVWTGNRMVVWGGGTGAVQQNTGARYDPSSDTWTPTSTGGSVPLRRAAHSAVWTGNEMIVWGGYYYDANAGMNLDLATGARYSPASDTWTALSTAGAPVKRSGHTAVWTGSEMIVWGGSPNSSALGYDTGARYSVASDTWRATTTTAAPAARSRHVAFWTGSEMLVWGGMTPSADNTGGLYDPGTDVWRPTSTGANVAPPGSSPAVWTGAEMIAWGPEGSRYSPATNSWAPVGRGSVPSPRDGQRMVSTGTDVLVWGGRDPLHSFVPLGDGRRYNLATDTWSPMAGLDAPVARYAHSAIWTGSEMIVWGGLDATSTALKSGARYAPLTNAWTPTPSSGKAVPQARSNHSAVWTGSEMIVWGGCCDAGGGALNTGARYAPNTNSWTATYGAPGYPEGLRDHTAVWTGSQMVVWGLRPNGSNYGSRYQPDIDDWLDVSTVNAPPPRAGHTALWTGTRMIVWGGHDFQNASYFNSGGRYEPVSDTWLATATAGAPSPRYQHVAAWSGKHMLVWSGADASGVLDDGGRYDDALDSWTPMTVDRAPASRYGAAAAWSPSAQAMVVWGGGFNEAYTSAGGVYCSLACSVTAPAHVANVTVSRSGAVVTITWAPVSAASGYDVDRGSTSQLAAAHGDFAVSTAACLANDTTQTSVTDASNPAAGDAWWYLVRAVNCGGDGSWDDGAGNGQTAPRDPGLDAAPGGCRQE